MNTTTFGVSELTANEMVSIDGGVVDPITLGIATYLVGSFLAGVAIGIALGAD